MRKYYFCTYFDQNYLSRALVLLDSLKQHCHSLKLFVLCLDTYTYEYLKKEESDTVVPIALAELEQKDKELLEAKSNRSIVEYFFTLSPCLPLYILDNYPEVDLITYIDSDLYFYSSPEVAYKELGDKSVYITTHRFEEKNKSWEVHGVYNVGFQIFRNDAIGRACLERWRTQCIEWCYDKLEENRYADQKYLDEWPLLYKDKLVVAAHPGINLAPWNIGGVSLQLRDNRVMVDGVELVFYHFHRLRFIKPKLVTHGLDNYHVKPHPIIKNSIYAPYIGAMIRKNHQLNRKSDKTGRLYKKYSLREIFKLLRKGKTFYYLNDSKCLRPKASLK